MTLSHRAQLEQIRTFPQLIRFLRDEMAWPIESEDFEELTFTYTLEELGIASGSAAKSAEIKRLRPLVANQPWGIFFVKFEPRLLPVVALRRILSAFVTRKRASANSADRMTWETDDLLFISSYGEDEERQLSFAHFSPSIEGSGLPTLKVLGWDNLDTALHLDAVAETLTQRLVWPANDADAHHWRESWRSAFTLRHREVIATSRELSIRLAELARAIRDRISTALAIETERGPLTKLMTAFREALVHDLTPDGFADMYAQTIAYGLLSARIGDPKSKTTSDLGAHMRTNPLLRDLMTTFLDVGGTHDGASGQGLDFDELGVNEVVELLDDANMEAVLRDFGDRNPLEDPVIHFYELFLKEYDSKQKLKRGVFYTPRTVVAYIVRSVDEMLREECGLEDGLADTAMWSEMTERHENLVVPSGVPPGQDFVQILDPATGTGTFLVEAIDVVHKTMMAKWESQGHSAQAIEVLWNAYVPEHLLPRLNGFEIMMAPYAIAHLKIGLKLHETGYQFRNEARAQVFLTNALEPASDGGQQAFSGMLPALAHEALALNEVKKTRCFTVVIGNPPYSLMSANLGAQQRALVDAYRFVDGVKLRERGALQLEKNLQDDYVKFMRTAQVACDRSPLSIMGLITNHSYLDNPTLRGLRRSLMSTFTTMRILDLHGNTKRKERCPLPARDENVFDIQQGVAILVAARTSDAAGTDISWGELWGSRADKYNELAHEGCGRLSSASVVSKPPLYLFSKQDDELRDEFDAGLPLDAIFSVYSTGVATARDKLTVHITPEGLHSTVQEMSSLGEEPARDRFGLGPDTNDWKVGLAIEDLRRTGPSSECERSYQYRPFDRRYTYYTGHPRGFLCNPRWPVMRHLLAGPNLVLCSVKSVETGHDYAHVFVSNVVTDHHSVSLKEVNYVFPVLTYPDTDRTDGQRGLFDGDGGTPKSNLTPEFAALLERGTGATFAEDLPATTVGSLDARGAVAYVYAILHSPRYRSRYAAFLRREYARIPAPPSLVLFQELVRLGEELIAVHLLESPLLDSFNTTYVGPLAPQVVRITWSEDTVWLDDKGANESAPVRRGSAGFHGVTEGVWAFHVGGYRVCEKWLKDRKGRTLSDGDIAHYQRIVVALSETIRLMGEIDVLIEQHGGWPGAFATMPSASGS